jgi:hypothetical protein
MRAGYGESLRNHLLEKTQPIMLIDLGSGVFDSATVDTAILILSKENKKLDTKAITLDSQSRRTNMSAYIKNNLLNLKFKMDDLWVILNPIELSIKQKIEKYGTPIKDMPNIKISRGILTGLNEAFIINDKKRMEILNNCESEAERIETDKLIRPILRGKDIGANVINWQGLFVIYAYFGFHKQIEKFQSIKKHLLNYESDLKMRGQVRYNSSGKSVDSSSRHYKGYEGQHHWLELDNNPSLELLDEFKKQKIIYSEIVNKPQFFFDKGNNFLVEATGFYLTCDCDLEYLTTCLNSSTISFAYKRFYSGGGLGEQGYRYKKAFIENLPIPMQEEFKNSEIKEKDIQVVLNLSKEEIKFIEDYIE